MKNLTVDHTYLIKRNHSDSLDSITILLITDKAYHIRWNNGLNSTQSWETKEYMYDKHRLIEDISDFVADKPNWKDFQKEKETILDVKTKLVTCHVCKEFGYVPDNNSTAGTKSCSLCFGSKMIPEVTEILQK